MLEPVPFTTPERKKTAYSTERCLNEWWSMGTLGNWHHVTFTFELCGRRFPSGSRISWFSCYLYVAFMAQDGSRWLKIFHDIPNKYRHGASPPWTLKTPCDFYSLHRWCTSSTKEVTQESSAVNAPTRRDSESKVEYLGQVGGRHRAATIGGWNQWNILFKWKITVGTPLRKAPYYHMSQLFGTFYQTWGFCVLNGYDL